jgi:hypothetical protein
MQTPETDSSKLSFGRWIVGCLLLTIVATIVALAIPGEFRFHGLFNVAIGIVIGTGCRWIAGDFGRFAVPSVSSRWKKAITVVLLLSSVSQIAMSAGSWLRYRALVQQAWKDDPTTIFTARILNDQTVATETNGQQQLDQMKQLFDENAAKRLDALKTRSSLKTWVVKRVDKKIGINSPGTATAFWFGEICLGCLAALFGFVRRPSDDKAGDHQTV